MAVKRAKTSRRSGATGKSAGAPAKANSTKVTQAKVTQAKVTKLSSARRRLSSKGPATAAKKKAAASKARAGKSTKAGKPHVLDVVEHALDEMKAVNVKVLEVSKLTDITDTMIIASGNSDRHVRSIADRVVEHAKKAGYRPMGVEGERDGEWVLVDLQDVIVHIMLPKVREFYRLESLWDVSAARREAAEQSA
jgi:ribosome-associated protein